MLFNVSLNFKQLGVVQLPTNLFQYLRRLSENNEQHLAGKKTSFKTYQSGLKMRQRGDRSYSV